MPKSFNARLQFIRSALDRPIPKLIGGLLAVLSFYDLFLSQFLPPDVSQDMPRAWHVLAAVNDCMPNMPPLGWVALWAVFVAAVSIEYGMEKGGQAPPKPPPLPPANTASRLVLGEQARQAPELEQPPVTTQAPKPRYAPPKEAADRDIQTLTYRQLGGLMVALSNDIGEMLMRTMREPSEQVPIFNRLFASRFCGSTRKLGDAGIACRP